MSSFHNTPRSPSGPRHSSPITGNLPFLLNTNLKLALCFLPSLTGLVCFLFLGGLIFLSLALLGLLLAAPGITAMYEAGYCLMAEETPDDQRFFISYRRNFKASAATMALLLPLIAMPLMLLGLTDALPPVITGCMLLGCVILQTFGVLAFSRIALTDLPLGKIWKQSLLMIPLTGWRGVAAAVLQLIFIMALVQYLPIMIFVFLFGIPSLLMALCCKILWPVMEGLSEDSE